MGFDLPPFRLNAAANALHQALQSRENRKVTLNIVNQLFGQAGYPFRDASLGIATRQYGAPLASVDFTRKAKAVTKLINDWIAEQTNGHINGRHPTEPAERGHAPGARQRHVPQGRVGPEVREGVHLTARLPPPGRHDP